jgi:hypothetical protein
MKREPLTAEGFQLLDATFGITWLADDLAAEQGYLVRPNYDRVSVAMRDGFGLGSGQPSDQIHGRLSWQRCFVDVRRRHREADRKPFEKLSPEL